MKRMGKVTRLIVALLTFTLLFELFPIGSENNLNKVQAATTLNNPRTVEDSSMNAKQKVTWDCVWFGAYPQSEVASGDIYNKLKNATGWDENNDIVIDGNKYRRLKGEDATYYNTKRVLNYYDWIEDYSTYHYFKYEAIKWRVLNVSNGEALLLADQALDSQRYNQNSEDITWEKSSIRSWLNAQDTMNNQEGINYRKGNFLNEAFFLSEQAGILPRSITNKNNGTYNTSGGNNTLDKIFLLAETQICGLDAKKYGFIMDHSIDDEARQSKCAEYAFAMGCYKFVETKYAENVNWWLRSPGGSSKAALKIDYDGRSRTGGSSIDSIEAIRPALYLKISSSNLYSDAGTVCSDGTINEELAPTRVYQDNTSSGNTGNNSGSNNNTGNNNSNNANNTGNNNSNNANNTENNNSNNTNNNKNNTTANTKPSNKTTASKKPTKRALLPVEKMTGSLKSVKSPAKSTLAITWKKLRKVTGYQVQFCAKSNFKKGTIERKFKQKVTKTKVRPLKSKKKYYVRMRPYAKSGSKMYYGKWSKVKSVKIK
nr:DUF6273 domain-containing protein [uncultured Anaerobutyricum sp.]